MNKFFRLYAPLVLSLVSLFVVVVLIFKQDHAQIASFVQTKVRPQVLGNSVVATPTYIPRAKPQSFDSIVSPITVVGDAVPIVSPQPPLPPVALPPQAAPESYVIALANAPGELVDGNSAAFTWYVSGSPNTIHTSTIYFGTTSTPGTLSTSIFPAQTHYTDAIKDFLHGDYALPIRFVGNTTALKQGTYYYRAYAQIGDKHYWTDEHILIVKEAPLNQIRLVSYPTTIDAGSNASFTWEIVGPASTTNFTAIVGGKVSKPGPLDVSVDIGKTPYEVLVKDFINGSYNLPLRLVGNGLVGEAGTYYFRAVTFINGKYIWSDESSFVVNPTGLTGPQ